MQNKHEFFKKGREIFVLFPPPPSNAGHEMIIIFMGLQSL